MSERKKETRLTSYDWSACPYNDIHVLTAQVHQLVYVWHVGKVALWNESKQRLLHTRTDSQEGAQQPGLSLALTPVLEKLRVVRLVSLSSTLQGRKKRVEEEEEEEEEE